MHSSVTRNVRPYSGSSMSGVLCSGDQVLLTDCPFENLHPGDIIVFASPRHPEDVIHRVIERLPDGLRTRGDRSPVCDAELVTPETYRGKVNEVIRGNRRIPVAGGRRGLWQLCTNRLRRRLLSLPAWMVRPIRQRFGDTPFAAFLVRMPGVYQGRYAGPDENNIHKISWHGKALATRDSQSEPWRLRFQR